MDLGAGRSTGVNETLVAPASSRPAEAAFERLYRSSRDDVYAYAAGVLRDWDAAEEVTALAFERAYRKWRTFRPERGSPRAWLFGIARNAALDELRRRRRIVGLVDEPADPAPTAGPQAADDSLRRMAVRNALDSLSLRERELIVLKFHAGLTNAELARVLGVSETNAGTLLHRTMEKLRRACDETA
jgi:RNA polymerase sigma-70 factor (ECF subfamily)